MANLSPGSTPPKISRIKGRLAIWQSCAQCFKPRWVLLRNGKPQSKICKECRNKSNKNILHQCGPDHWNWKGGRSQTKSGYVEVWVAPDHQFASMRNKDGYVLEHRIKMAKKLGRPLTRQEEVHHKNDRKNDNRPSNLILMRKSDHSSETNRTVMGLRKEVARLRGLLKC